MGGSSSSQAQQTQQQDNRIVTGQNGVTATNGSYVNVTTMDAAVAHDAFGLARDSTAMALGSNTQLAELAINSNQHAADQVMSSLNSTETLVANAYNDAKGRGAMTDKILIGAIVMTGLVAVYAVKGKA